MATSLSRCADCVGEETCHDSRGQGRLDLGPLRQQAAGDLLDGLGGFCLAAVSYMELVIRIFDPDVSLSCRFRTRRGCLGSEDTRLPVELEHTSRPVAHSEPAATGHLG